MNIQYIKTRFCPSPTGHLHLGNVRTALFNAFFAEKRSGTFLLRIEDTDQSRSREDYVQSLCADLAWLGLNWYSGSHPDQRGKLHKMDYQSNRIDLYRPYTQQLLKEGDAYRCFCDKATLDQQKRQQIAARQPPRYLGTCRHLSAAQIDAYTRAEKPSVLRFHVPDRGMHFHDLVYGEQTIDTRHTGDFIIQRSDQTPSFIYCNALDDALMGVTHVMRGEDHLSNTVRQRLILDALGLKAPQYAHLPLIKAEDGQGLSKRTGSLSLQSLRAQGFLPEAIHNYLARLGHDYEGQFNQLLPWKTLAQHFSLETLSHRSPSFQMKHLLYWQKQAVLALDETAMHRWLGHLLVDLSRNEQFAFIVFIRDNIKLFADVSDWLTSCYAETLTFDEDHRSCLEATGVAFWQTAFVLCEKYTEFEAWQHALKGQTDLKGKGLYHPLRIALTNRMDGPTLRALHNLRGHDWFKARFQTVLRTLT